MSDLLCLVIICIVSSYVINNFCILILLKERISMKRELRNLKDNTTSYLNEIMKNKLEKKIKEVELEDIKENNFFA